MCHLIVPVVLQLAADLLLLLWVGGRVSYIFIEVCHCKHTHQVGYWVDDVVLTKINNFFPQI